MTLMGVNMFGLVTEKFYYDISESSEVNHVTAEEGMWKNHTWNAPDDRYHDIPKAQAYMGEDIAPPYLPEPISETNLDFMHI